MLAELDECWPLQTNAFFFSALNFFRRLSNVRVLYSALDRLLNDLRHRRCNLEAVRRVAAYGCTAANDRSREAVCRLCVSLLVRLSSDDDEGGTINETQASDRVSSVGVLCPFTL